jgi:hypothetical protein
VTPPPPASRRVWTRYVAIGTRSPRGCPTRTPPARTRTSGWADRLAHHLDAIAEREHLPFGYANLAVRGPQARRRRRTTARRADDMQPDLVSMVGGGNDLLRPQVDLDGLASRLEEAGRAAAAQRRRRAARDAHRHPGRRAVQGRCAAGTPCTPQPVHDRPAARLLRAQPVGHGRAARTGGCGPRTASTSRRRATAGWRSPRSPRSGTAPTWPTGPPRCPRPTGRPARRAARARAVGTHLRRARGCSAGAGPLVRRRLAPSGRGSSTSATPRASPRTSRCPRA